MTDVTTVVNNMKVCNRCKKWKDNDEFNAEQAKAGITLYKTCKSCRDKGKTHAKKHRAEEETSERIVKSETPQLPKPKPKPKKVHVADDCCKVAWQLYDLCKNEEDNKHTHNPFRWLCNQAKHRNHYEQYLTKLDSIQGDCANIIKTVLLNNSCMKYEKHMYDSFPPCFDEHMKEIFNNNEKDIIDIFWDVSYGKNRPDL